MGPKSIEVSFARKSRSACVRTGASVFAAETVAWDMAMLVQDARRPVSQAASDAAITTYLDRTGRERAAFEARLAVVGTLNALRITGLFARLVKRDGKDRYLDFMARQQTLLARNLAHPAAADMAGYVRDVAPFIFEARS